MLFIEEFEKNFVESVPSLVFCSFIVPAPDGGGQTTRDIRLLDKIDDGDGVSSEMKSDGARTWQSRFPTTLGEII